MRDVFLFVSLSFLIFILIIIIANLKNDKKIKYINILITRSVYLLSESN